jgi:hypothetical protein
VFEDAPTLLRFRCIIEYNSLCRSNTHLRRVRKESLSPKLEQLTSLTSCLKQSVSAAARTGLINLLLLDILVTEIYLGGVQVVD